MKKLIAILAFALFSFNAQSAETNTWPSVTKGNGNSFASAATPIIQFCKTNQTASFTCSPIQSLPSLFSYYPITNLNSLMSYSNCLTTIQGGVFVCGQTSTFSQTWGGNSVWWAFQDNGYLGAIYIMIYN